MFSQTINIPQKVRLAKSYEAVKEYEKALEIFKELNKINPKDYTFVDGVKRNLRVMERYDELTSFLENVLKYFVNNQNILGDLSRVYYQIGKFDKAKETWQRILNIDPGKQFYYTFVADIQFKLRLVDDAIETLLAARKNTGNNFTIANNLATFYRWRRDFKHAAEEYIGLYFLRKNYYGTVLGTIMSFPDDSVTYAQVTEVIGNAIKKNEDINLYRIMYNYQIKSKNYEQAFNTCMEIDSLGNRKGLEILNFSRSAFLQNALVEAENGFNYLVNNYTNFASSGEVAFYLAYTKEKMIELNGVNESDSLKYVNYINVINKYEKISRDFKGQNWQIEALFRAGEILFNVFFDLDKAIKAYTEATMSPLKTYRTYEASIRIGDCLLAKGHLAAAQKIFENNTLIDPKKYGKIKNTALFKSAKVDYYKGELQNTLDKIDAIINSNPLDRDLINDCLELKMLISDNLENYKNALLIYAGAERLILQKNYGEALTYLDQIIVNFKNTELAGNSLFLMAQISEKIAKYEDSAEYLKQLINGFSENRYFEDAYKMLGRIYSENLDNKDEAVKIYENFIINHPNSMNVDYIRKQIRELEKKTEG
ncbi:tetratricopeptide repeat protein [candidate division KSB1 bacterium]